MRRRKSKESYFKNSALENADKFKTHVSNFIEIESLSLEYSSSFTNMLYVKYKWVSPEKPNISHPQPNPLPPRKSNLGPMNKLLAIALHIIRIL